MYFNRDLKSFILLIRIIMKNLTAYKAIHFNSLASVISIFLINYLPYYSSLNEFQGYIISKLW